ncbi:MAG: ribonuclease HII [Acidobacteria bacterium]|nr:ribonuclease HII [Acidobacteriota bacterium]
MPRLRPSLRTTSPSLEHERALWNAGARFLIGVDEVGRGSWAGPLTVAVVAPPRESRIYKVRDSKMLSEAERESLYERIVAWADSWAVGHASPKECDVLGMADAQRLATKRALALLPQRPDHALVDGNWDFVAGPQTHLFVKGDARCLSIAAASVVAKVTRDRILRDLDKYYPQYDFASSKGYPSPNHRRALHGYGPSVVHRKSWAWMDDLAHPGVQRLSRPSRQEAFFD